MEYIFIRQNPCWCDPTRVLWLLELFASVQKGGNNVIIKVITPNKKHKSVPTTRIRTIAYIKYTAYAMMRAQLSDSPLKNRSITAVRAATVRQEYASSCASWNNSRSSFHLLVRIIPAKIITMLMTMA